MRTRLSKAAFYRYGGLANRNLFRLMRGGHWTYWKDES